MTKSKTAKSDKELADEIRKSVETLNKALAAAKDARLNVSGYMTPDSGNFNEYNTFYISDIYRKVRPDSTK